MTKKKRDDQELEQPLEEGGITPERADRFTWDDDAAAGITIKRAEPQPHTTQPDTSQPSSPVKK